MTIPVFACTINLLREMREDQQMSDIDHGDYDLDDVCPNCGGEGVVYSCFEEWACVDPEGGCDLCESRCDWCRPRKPKGSAVAPADGNST